MNETARPAYHGHAGAVRMERVKLTDMNIFVASIAIAGLVGTYALFTSALFLLFYVPAIPFLSYGVISYLRQMLYPPHNPNNKNYLKYGSLIFVMGGVALAVIPTGVLFMTFIGWTLFTMTQYLVIPLVISFVITVHFGRKMYNSI